MIHVVTPCSRPANLPALLESISGALKGPWTWWIVLDRRHVKGEVRVPGANVLEMDSCGIGGHAARNHILWLIEDGWIVWIDDDNRIHQDLPGALILARLEHPEALGFVFHAIRGDGSPYASPNGPGDSVDTACLVFHREAIGSVRWNETRNDADQGFHQEVVKRNQGKIVYVPKVAAFYNALKDAPP